MISVFSYKVYKKDSCTDKLIIHANITCMQCLPQPFICVTVFRESWISCLDPFRVDWHFLGIEVHFLK